jgi:2-aminoadipate transaminase
MEYEFSDRVQKLKPSAIREIFKYAADPSYISLSAGNPSPEAFPVKQLADISDNLMRNEPILALQYNFTEGYPELRKELVSYLKKYHNIGRENDMLIITTGAQQIADLLSKSVVNEGDTVISESPSFIGCLNTFRAYNANLVGATIDSDGMNMDELENLLKTEKNVRFIYTIPNYQNPSGITMSLEKRHRIYDLAKKYKVLILEDNPYGDLRYSGEYISPIKSFDEDGIVIYSGSFSKVIAPGLRVGYVIGPQPIIQKMVVCKQGADVHTNIWSQVLCYRFMTQYDFQAHLEGLRKLYTKKQQFLIELMKENFLPYITWDKFDGGLFTWCHLPKDVDMLDFCKKAVERKVCVVPGTAFLTDTSESTDAFRINFTTPTDEQLEKGIKILGQLIKDIKEGKI